MTTEQVEVSFGKITEEALAKMRAKFGVPYYPPRQNEVATKDAIRHFCYGTGDENPLFLDSQYASKTRWGHLIAPSFFLYAISAPQGMEGLPGVHAFHCGCNWEWFRAIHVNDEITAVDIPLDLIEKQGKMGGRQFLQVGKTIYRNQRGEIIAINKRETMRIERQEAKERGKYSEVKRHQYDEAGLEAINDGYEAEEVRGANPRFWEDVNVGDQLVPVVKGPLGMSDIMDFWVGIGGGWGAHRLRWKYMRRHPRWGVKDPKTSVMEPMVDVHYDSTKSGAIGVPVAYDYAIQRFSWAGHLITNWMGDDGFLKKISLRCVLFNVFGDTQFLKGAVTKKYQEGGEYLVDVEIKCENQRGELTMPGTATVSLPSKVQWV